MKNKQSKVYGLKFSYGEYAFKASEVGREFGYRSLQKNFEASRKAETNVSDQVIRKSSENTDTMETGYQLVPPSRSYSPRPTEEVPQIAKAVSEVSDAVISAADEIVEELGEMIHHLHIAKIMQKQHGSASSDTKPTERRSEDEDIVPHPTKNSITKMQKEEYSLKTLVIRQKSIIFANKITSVSLFGRNSFLI